MPNIAFSSNPKETALRNLENLLPEINALLDSIKQNFSNLRLSTSPLTLSDTESSNNSIPEKVNSINSTNTHLEQLSDPLLKPSYTNSGRRFSSFLSRQHESDSFTASKVYKSLIMLNTLMVQYQNYLKILSYSENLHNSPANPENTTPKISDSSTLEKLSRTDSNGYRRPAVFNYLLNIQNAAKHNITSTYLDIENLSLLLNISKLWDSFYNTNIDKLAKIRSELNNLQKSNSSSQVQVSVMNQIDHETLEHLTISKSKSSSGGGGSGSVSNNKSSKNKKVFESIRVFIVDFSGKVKVVIKKLRHDFEEDDDE